MVNSVVKAASENPPTAQARLPLHHIPQAKKANPSSPRTISETATQRISSPRCKTAWKRSQTDSLATTNPASTTSRAVDGS